MNMKALLAVGLLGISGQPALAQSSRPGPQQPAEPLFTRADVVQPRVIEVIFIVSDMTKADNFYANVLGLEPGPKISHAGGAQQWFYRFPGQDRTRTVIALATGPSPKPSAGATGNIAPASPQVVLNFSVPDVKSIVAKVEAAGGKVIDRLETRTNGLVRDHTVITDPDGHIIELTHFH
jgi:catechol 2,3-dioxygenase-like lactoylglutathione lyase family enzyme